MKQIILLINLLLNGYLFSQISMKIDKVENIHNNKIVLDFTIENLSSENIAIPFDTVNFRMYGLKECYFTKHDLENYPYLSLAVKFMKKSGENITAHWGLGTSDFYAPPKPIKTKRKSSQYIYEKIIYLKPNENIKFRKEINFDYLIFDEIPLYYEYSELEKNTEYEFSFVYCSEKAHTYYLLNRQQKKRLRKYKFYNGKIESNFLKFIYE